MTSPAAAPHTPDAFEERVAEMKRREADRLAQKHMWHAHHWPDEYERCVHVAGRPVCRRCLTLYPAAIAVAIAYLGGLLLWPASLDPWLIWALCIPASADFVLEQLGVIRYSGRRQLVTTALLAPALGRGMGYELADTWSWEFWGPVLVFCNVWFWATTIGKSRQARMEVAHG